jgi:hypothetical protein
LRYYANQYCLVMKNLYSATLLFAGIVIASCLISSCGKKDTTSDKPKEQQVVGFWATARVQLKVYYNNDVITDTIPPQQSFPKNYVQFDANGDFEYLLSTPAAYLGTYQFKGTDSIICTTPSKIYRWKMLTLTDQLFTVMNTSKNDPAYPGSLKVETYHTFVR